MNRFLTVIGAVSLALTSCATSPDYAAARQEAHLLMASGHHAEAAEYLDAHGDFSDPVVLMLRGEAAFYTGDYEGAVARFGDALEMELTDSARRFAQSNLAEALRAAGNPKAAYEILLTLSQETGSSDELELRMGACCVAAEDMDLAREHFAKLPQEARARIADLLGHDFIVVSQND